MLHHLISSIKRLSVLIIHPWLSLDCGGQHYALKPAGNSEEDEEEDEPYKLFSSGVRSTRGKQTMTETSDNDNYMYH